MAKLKLALLLFIALAWGPALSGCSDSEGGATPARAQRPGEGSEARPDQAPVPIAVSPAITGAIAATYSATATLQPNAQADVLARVSGLVEAIEREAGDRIEREGALLQIDNDAYRVRVQQAEARTANLRARFERMNGMAAKDLVSAEEFDTARSELATAEADEELARLDLGYTTVRAPFRGRIVARLVDPGQNVSVGTPLFRIADLDPLLAEVHVPSKEFRALETDQPVTLILDSDRTRLQGRIKLVSPIIDPASGTIKVTVEIRAVPENVRPGDFAEVRIVTEQRTDRTLVPRVAVITDKGENVVFVEMGGRAERRTVATGFSDEQHFEIISGVQPGELVVVKGQRSLRHGQAVRVLEDAPDGGTAVVGAGAR